MTRGQVLLFYLSLCEGFGEPEPGRLGAGRDQHAARAPIEAMNESWAAWRADSCHLRVPVDQPVGESTPMVARTRMHHQSRPFVDDNQPGILVENLERHRFRR